MYYTHCTLHKVKINPHNSSMRELFLLASIYTWKHYFSSSDSDLLPTFQLLTTLLPEIHSSLCLSPGLSLHSLTITFPFSKFKKKKKLFRSSLLRYNWRIINWWCLKYTIFKVWHMNRLVKASPQLGWWMCPLPQEFFCVYMSHCILLGIYYRL